MVKGGDGSGRRHLPSDTSTEAGLEAGIAACRSGAPLADRLAASAGAEAEDQVLTVAGRFLSFGRNGYEKMATYQYVGKSETDADFEAPKRTVRAVLSSLLFVVSLVALGYYGSERHHLRIVAERGQQAAEEPFDCGSQGQLTAAKTEYCCIRHNAFCTAEEAQRSRLAAALAHAPGLDVDDAALRVPAAGDAALAFDCAAGFEEWRKLWGPEKQSWCCQHEKRGCHAEARAFQVIARTPAELARDEDRTAFVKASATTSPAPTAGRFDCVADFDAWALRWSPARQTWCCEHQNRGCPLSAGWSQEVLAPVFDCEEDAAQWQTLWSDSKKDYCCSGGQAGCVGTTVMPS